MHCCGFESDIEIILNLKIRITFIKRMKKAKKMEIQKSIYQHIKCHLGLINKYLL